MNFKSGIYKFATKEEKKQLENYYNEKNKERDLINKLEDELRKRLHAKHIGKCYKFENSYDNERRWWLYFNVEKIGENGEPIGISFEYIPNADYRDSSEIEIKNNYKCSSLILSAEEITEDEFNQAWKDIFIKVMAIDAGHFMPKRMD